MNVGIRTRLTHDVLKKAQSGYRASHVSKHVVSQRFPLYDGHFGFSGTMKVRWLLGENRVKAARVHITRVSICGRV